MAELAVLGILIGLWRAVSASEQIGPHRDHVESSCGWVLVGVSVLLALTATFPDSLTNSSQPCRAASCGGKPRADDAAPALPRIPAGTISAPVVLLQPTG